MLTTEKLEDCGGEVSSHFPLSSTRLDEEKEEESQLEAAGLYPVLAASAAVCRHKTKPLLAAWALPCLRRRFVGAWDLSVAAE